MTITIAAPIVPPTRPKIVRTSDGGYRLMQSMRLATPMEEVFDFFADVQNLNLITPPWLAFEILTPGEINMGVGALIDYRLKLHGVSLSWTSEMTIWDPHRMFVDTQVRGPFKEWHHMHSFKEIDSTTTDITDKVDYRVPAGRLVHRLFVKRDLEAIFAYRAERIAELLGGTP